MDLSPIRRSASSLNPQRPLEVNLGEYALDATLQSQDRAPQHHHHHRCHRRRDKDRKQKSLDMGATERSPDTPTGEGPPGPNAVNIRSSTDSGQRLRPN